MPRFLHTADWQIGRRYSQFPDEDAVPLAEARLAAVETIARLAAEHRVDAVLVAGDVFDAQTVSDRTLRRLFAALAAFSGPWVMIPGNHDAALTESVWSRAMRLGAIPPNVHAVLQPGVLDFAAQGFAVLTAPLTQRHTHDDLTAWFDAAETPPGAVRIGLAHGSVEGILAEDIDSPNPIASDRAASARLDYFALGDWHGCKRIDDRTWYSGTPEPDRFKDNDPGFALLVELDGPGAIPQVTRLETARHAWRSASHIITVPSDVDAFVARLTEVRAGDVLDVRVSGRVDLNGLSRVREALERTDAAVRSLLADISSLRLEPTEDDIARLNADGYLGETLSVLRTLQGGTDPAVDTAVADRALMIFAGLLLERRDGASGA